jgi:hypothetical protein
MFALTDPDLSYPAYLLFTVATAGSNGEFTIQGGSQRYLYGTFDWWSGVANFGFCATANDKCPGSTW